MDDFEDVNDMSFVLDDDDDIGNDNDNNNAGNGNLNSNADHGANYQPDQPSQDHDFQTQVPVVLRPRKDAAQIHVPEPKPTNVETEESTCCICFEPWTNSGGHRLVSIKCGHLFGESCILKWIAHNTQDGSAKCPECNHRTKRKDVRRIWSKSVVVLDTTERDEVAARVRKEQELRIRCEKDLAQSKMAYEMLKSEMARLERKYDHQRSLKHRYRAEVQRLWLAAPQANINRLFSYQAYRVVPIEIKVSENQLDLGQGKPTATAHYMSFRQDEEMIVCSRQVSNVHGIAKISMRDFSNNLHEIIPIHSQAIRDVQCYSGDPAVNKSLVLTASMDKTLKVTSAASQHVVLSYDLMAPAWSCCWSKTDPFAIYCSVKANQTSILTFDLRNTKTPVASFSRPALLGHSPIHSMAHIGPYQTQKREGILCGNLEGAFIYNFESHDSYGVLSQESVTSGSQGHDSVSDHERRIPLRFQESSCSSVSFDSVSRQWMASFKFLGKPFTRHVRGRLEQDESNGSLLLKSEINVAGGPPVWAMSRTSVFSRNDGSVHMAAGSEGMAHIWHESSRANSSRSQESTLEATSHGEFSPSLKEDESLERLVIESSGYEASYGPCPVKDIKAVSVGQHEYVAMLSDRQLELFRWSETRPGDFYASDDDSVGSEDNEEREGKGKKRARHEIAAGATVITLDDD